MERGHLTDSKAMTPEQNDKCKRYQAYEVQKKNGKRSLLCLIRELYKENGVKGKRYTGAAQDGCMHHTSAEMMSDRNL